MGALFQLVGLLLKGVVMLLWYSGAWGFVLWLVIFENTIAKLMPKPFYDGIGGAIFGWGFGLVIMGYILLNNIIRFVTQNPKFSIFKLILGVKIEQGFLAQLNKDSLKDLSGFVFGKLNGKYITKKEEVDGHILVVGGPGSGKTSSLAIPTLMSWKERVFAIDIKGELYKKTAKRRDTDKIKVFNPTDPNAYGYDPFFMLKNTDDLSSEAKALAISICPLPADVKDPFWLKSAQNMLTGFLIYFFERGYNFSNSMIEIKSKPVKDLVSEIMESGNKKAIMEVSQFSGMDDKTVSGVFSELSNHITIFATNNDLVRALSGTGKCITPADLESGYDIFCCIPEHKLDQWKELFGMMVNQFLKFFERREDGNERPILFLIDEFPRLGKIETIVGGLGTLRSKKIQIALFVQSKSQLNANYGADLADVIADNCSYKAILKAGTPVTQKWCSELVGTYDKVRSSTSKNMDMIGFGKGMGTAETTENSPIIKPEEFGFMNDVVCIFPTGWYRVEKASCYEDKTFQIESL